MARGDPQVNLRIPAELKAALEASATQAQRSLNAEIVARLRDSIEAPVFTGEQLAAIRKMISEATRADQLR